MGFLGLGIPSTRRLGPATFTLLPLAALATALLLGGCGGDKDASKTAASELENLAVPNYKVTFPPLQPFDPDEWETAKDYPQIADPRAKKVPGATFTRVWPNFVPNLRTDGPNTNLMSQRTLRLYIFEALIGTHPETEQPMPLLATHWKIETDLENETQTFWFRLDERARFSDGTEVTADDVQKSFWHLIQEDRKDPSNMVIFQEAFEMPEVVDKYTIKVKTKKLNWRLFYYFGGMWIFPARFVSIPGDKFLKEYNWRIMPGSGPYILKNPKKDLKKGASITLTRRDDWWGWQDPENEHTYNFEKLRFEVIREQELQYEKFKKGDLDQYRVTRAQRWVEDIPKEEIVQKGYVKRRKVYNQSPQGFSGFVFNMRKPPFNDKRVRLAFAYLFNRERLMEKLFFHEYEFVDSYFPGRDWGNEKNNPKLRFDPDRAEELLAEAGYKKRDSEGYLIGPDGKRFEVTVPYSVQAWERIWLVVKEDYEAAGIKFNLELIDFNTLYKKQDERQFTVYFQSWGAILFPNPESSWRSSLADKMNNNNVAGFKNERVDELCRLYDRTFDRSAQKKIIKEIDSLIFAEHPYALAWYGPFYRIMFWDKFGYPDTYLTRIGTVPQRNMISYWWLDTEKEKRLKKAMGPGGKPLPQGEIVVKPWERSE